MNNYIYLGDNLSVLRGMPDESVDLIYIDPPFNTGKVQARKRLKTVRDENGDRVGFGENSYRTEVLSEQAYRDSFNNYEAFLLRGCGSVPSAKTERQLIFILITAKRYCKIMLDRISGGKFSE